MTTLAVAVLGRGLVDPHAPPFAWTTWADTWSGRVRDAPGLRGSTLRLDEHLDRLEASAT